MTILIIALERGNVELTCNFELTCNATTPEARYMI